MKEKTYLSRFSRIAKWRLPADVAAEVIADYAEILSEDTRSEAELRRDFGEPLQAVKEISSSKDYLCWMAVFAILSLCLILPVLWLWRPMYWTFHIAQGEKMSFVFMVLGAGLSLFWFFRKGNAKTAAALRRILPVAAFLLLLMLGMVSAFWYLVSQITALDLPHWIGQAVRLVLQLSGLASMGMGMYALVLSRILDRRWRAVYVLALTWAVLCVLSFDFISGINLSPAFEQGWWLPYCMPSLFVLLSGTVAAGVSLC